MSGHFLKDPAEIVAGTETQGGSNLLYGLVGAFQKDLCPLNFGKLDVVTDAKPRFGLELMGQVIFGISHHGCQIGGPDFLVQMHLDVIHTLLDRTAELGIGAAFVYPADKVIVHHQAQRIQIVQGFGGLGSLDITVTQSVGLLGRKPALNGCTAHQRGEHNHRNFALPQGVIAVYRDTGTQGHAVGQCLFVVQIPGAYHL